MFLVHNLTPSQDKILNWLCSNVPLYDIIILKKGIHVSLLILTDI